jgi:hypothetical protein
MKSSSPSHLRPAGWVIGLFVIASLIAGLTPTASMQQGGNFLLRPSVIAGGGGKSVNAATSVEGTIGQGITGTSAGGNFFLTAGFWQAPCASPSLTSQPQSQTVCEHTNVNLSVNATGVGLGFQWRKNGANITGATGATLTLNNAGATDAASYDCVVTNGCGATASNAATLTVLSYALSSMNQSFPSSGGTGSFNVQVVGACPWTAVSNNGWLTITGGAAGSGNGTVNFAVASTTTNRVGTITAAGLTFTVNQSGPSAITLNAFTATAYDAGVLLEWQTGFEVNNLGFRLYRDTGGRREAVTRELIGGSALRVGAGVNLESGEHYSWWDSDAAARGRGDAATTYWLEDVDLNGDSTWHGPFAARVAYGPPPPYSNAAMLSSLSRSRPEAEASRVVEAVAPTLSASRQQDAMPFIIDSQAALKLTVKREGWYRVTQPEMAAAGFPTASDPRWLQMVVEGREVPIAVVTSPEGRFDESSFIEFYGLGLDTPSTDARAYWLIAGQSPGQRIERVEAKGIAASGHSFTQTVERRERTIYFAALLNGERENFFGAVVTGQSLEQALNLPRLETSALQPATVEIALQGVTQQPHRVEARLNGQLLGFLEFNGQENRRAHFAVPHALLNEGMNSVRLTAQNGASDIALVEAIRVSYQHTFTAEDNQLTLVAAGGERLTIDGFTTKALRVFDVTDPDRSQELIGEVEQSKDGGYALTVAASGIGARRLVTLSEDRILRPAALKLHAPSALKKAAGADFVIITRREWFAMVEPLAARRESEGLRVALVDIEDVYDEFAFGNKRPQAIRDFFSYAKGNWKVTPSYALIVGDASYDPKNYLGYGENDVVPTKLVDTRFMETASDEWFGDFDGDGISEVMIGRLPARDAAEAARMIAKLLRYEQSGSTPSALLVSDANDGYNFEQTIDELGGLLPPSMRVEAIKRGQLDAATAKGRLLAALASGPQLVNYVGHGSSNAWRGDLLTAVEAGELTNTQLSVFVLMNCLNGMVQEASGDSLGEALLKAEGGAVAAWASSGMTFPQGQAEMNRALYKELFAARQQGSKDSAGRIGEAIQKAKRATSDIDIRRTWILLGDPTLRLQSTPTLVRSTTE